MRRRLGKFLPIVMIAVLVQLFAPVGASLAMSAALDPIASAPICASTDGEHGAQSTPNGKPPNHQSCCPLCAVAQGGALADIPVSIAVVPDRVVQGVIWSERNFDFASTRYAFGAQARAPPFHS